MGRWVDGQVGRWVGGKVDGWMEDSACLWAFLVFVNRRQLLTASYGQLSQVFSSHHSAGTADFRTKVLHA